MSRCRGGSTTICRCEVIKMSEIDQSWLNDFIDDIQNWFCVKNSNWSEVLTEGLLLIPACEFLIKRQWKVAGERSNHQIFGDNRKTVGYKSFDICAEKKADGQVHRILIEIKFLKPPKDKNGQLKKGAAINKNRIAEDIEKLRSVSHPCERIMVIGVHPFVTDGSSIIQNMGQYEDVQPIISTGGGRIDREHDGANVRIGGFRLFSSGAAEAIEQIGKA